MEWDETKNIVWKAEIPGRGWSSPVIVGDQIWLTAATEDDTSLRAICVDRVSGKVVHDIELFHLPAASKIHKKNTPASPTAIVQGDRVYIHFGRLGTACLKRTGEVVWKNNSMEFEHRHGPGGSPVLFENLLIFSCDGTDKQFIVALDKGTGKEVWRTEREGKMAYSTPLLVNVGGQPLVVSTCGEFAYAYEPLTGKEKWKSRYPEGYSNVPRPVFGHGMVYVCSGYNTPRFVCDSAGRRGRRDGHACRVESRSRRAVEPLATVGRRRSVHGVGQRNPHVPGRESRHGTLEGPPRRELLPPRRSTRMAASTSRTRMERRSFSRRARSSRSWRRMFYRGDPWPRQPPTSAPSTCARIHICTGLNSKP